MGPLDDSAGAPREPRVIPVGALTRAIAERLAGIGRVAVEGEVGAPKRAASGHLYFTLKERGAALSCAIWRSRVSSALRFRLEEGMRVVCHGVLDVYAPRGSYSLIVERVERRGIGELLAALEKLKARLAADGWFDRRRPLPPWPRVVGLVTSREADALRDFLRTREKRWPDYPLRLAPTPVQGAGAAEEVADAIARLDASGVDVICVVRGGGSLEDLWTFNELPVAQAIWRSSVPVVTGVGHESDTTLVDLVADHRAHTPTDAAQTVFPDRRALLERIERSGSYLLAAMERQLGTRAERLDRLAQRRVLRDAGRLLEERHAAALALGSRLLQGVQGRLVREGAVAERLGARLARQHPAERLARRGGLLEALGGRLEGAAAAQLEGRGRRLEVLERALGAVSPFAVLGRGYSITRRAAGGAPLLDAAELSPGERVETLLGRGSFTSTVAEVEEEQQ